MRGQGQRRMRGRGLGRRRRGHDQNPKNLKNRQRPKKILKRSNFNKSNIKQMTRLLLCMIKWRRYVRSDFLGWKIFLWLLVFRSKLNNYCILWFRPIIQKKSLSVKHLHLQIYTGLILSFNNYLFLFPSLLLSSLPPFSLSTPFSHSLKF